MTSPSIELLLDADATINLRSLGILNVLIASDLELSFSSHVFENELSSLSRELQPLRDERRAKVRSVLTRTPEHRVYRELLRERCVDKGEAEAIAWCRANPPAGERFFVTDDDGARTASRCDPVAISSAECVALLVATGRLTEAACRGHLTVWDDASKQHGRPKKWRSFDEDFAGLLARTKQRLGLA